MPQLVSLQERERRIPVWGAVKSEEHETSLKLAVKFRKHDKGV